MLWCIHDAFRLAQFKSVFERVKEEKELTIVAYVPVDSYLDEKMVNLFYCRCASSLHKVRGRKYKKIYRQRSKSNPTR